MFFFSFNNGDDDPARNSFDKLILVVLVEIKDFNALSDNKRFFDIPIKNEQEAYENLVEMSRNSN